MQKESKAKAEPSVYFERIQALMKALNVSSRAFSTKIGRSENWSRVPKKSYYVEDVVQIMRAYPEVNIRFLMYGEMPILSEGSEDGMTECELNRRLLLTVNQQNEAILLLSQKNAELMQKLAELTSLVIQKNLTCKENLSVSED